MPGKRGNKRNGTLYSVRTDGLAPSKAKRAVDRNEAHADDWLVKVAVAIRLQEYASKRMLTQMVDGHPREKWLQKVRRDFGNMPLDMSPDWWTQQQAMLAAMELPPLPKT